MLPQSRRVRLPLDTILDQRIFVYEYLDNTVLSLVRNQITLRAWKVFLKAALQGLADWHDHDIVHCSSHC
jgi:hypothetical protein